MKRADKKAGKTKKSEKSAPQSESSDYEIVGGSDHFKKLISSIKKVASSDDCVLILGPRGSGKENVAHNIHDKSNRKEQPFIPINCAGIPTELFESIFFGVGRNVATGVAQRNGVINSAEGGTLFLDEIGDLSLLHQAKFLRFLSDKTYSRVGEEEIDLQNSNIRIIAATNKNLEEHIEKGTFRADLYDRLSSHIIRTESLSKYPSDLILILNHYIQKKEKELDPRSKLLLYCYDFPGNVRELQYLIKRDFNELLEIAKRRLDQIRTENLERIRKIIEETELREKNRGQIQKYENVFKKNARDENEKREILENILENLDRMDSYSYKLLRKCAHDQRIILLNDAIELLEDGPTEIYDFKEDDVYSEEFGDLSQYGFSAEDDKDLEVLSEGLNIEAIKEIVLKHELKKQIKSKKEEQHEYGEQEIAVKRKRKPRKDLSFILYKELIKQRRKAIDNRNKKIINDRLEIYEIAILKQSGISNVSTRLQRRDEKASGEEILRYTIETPLDVFPEPIEEQILNGVLNHRLYVELLI